MPLKSEQRERRRFKIQTALFTDLHKERKLSKDKQGELERKRKREINKHDKTTTSV